MENALQQQKLVIACIEDPTKAAVLMRIARNRAQQEGAKWRAVFVGIAAEQKAKDYSDVQDYIQKCIAAARKAEGEALHIPASSAAEAAARILEGDNSKIALLILHNPAQLGFWKRRKTISSAIARYAGRLGVKVENVQVSEQVQKRTFREKFRELNILYIFYALLAVGFAFVAAFALREILPPALFRINNQNIGLLFMIACAFSAGRFGLLPGLVASFASFLIINYSFTVPKLNLSSVTDLLNMGIFLFAVLLISFFTGRTHGFAEKATRRELSAKVLFNLYRVASNVSTRKQALEKLQQHLARTLDMDVAFFMPQLMNNDALDSANPPHVILSEVDKRALDVCWKEMKGTGFGSLAFHGEAWMFKPMMAQGGPVGVIAVKPRARRQVDIWFTGMLMAIADQVATIIEHIDLASTMEATRISEEREKLRSMLLSSVSHDLKTPLSSIIGALNIYRSHADKIDAKRRASLIETALGEAERLDSFITNILDMTRLESKKIKFKQEWNDPHAVLQEIAKRLEHRMRNHKLAVFPLQGKAEVYMDYVMTGQVLQNLIDNACKYTPSGSIIEVRMIADKEKGFFYEVRDHGSGIPPEKMEHIFDKYARLQMRDSQIAGTGLGLAICRTIAEVQGGYIKVANHPDGGAVFKLQLPNWRLYQVPNLQAG